MEIEIILWDDANGYYWSILFSGTRPTKEAAFFISHLPGILLQCVFTVGIPMNNVAVICWLLQPFTQQKNRPTVMVITRMKKLTGGKIKK